MAFSSRLFLWRAPRCSSRGCRGALDDSIVKRRLVAVKDAGEIGGAVPQMVPAWRPVSLDCRLRAPFLTFSLVDGLGSGAVIMPGEPGWSRRQGRSGHGNLQPYPFGASRPVQVTQAGRRWRGKTSRAPRGRRVADLAPLFSGCVFGASTVHSFVSTGSPWGR